MNLNVVKIGEGFKTYDIVLSVDLDFWFYKIDWDCYQELPPWIRSSKKDFLQFLIANICKRMQIPDREVFSFKELPKSGFTDTFYEFIGTGNGFGWEYYIKTKSYNISKYFDIKENRQRIIRSTDKDEDQLIGRHFRLLIDRMECQGFFKGMNYYQEPSFSLIDNLTNQILRK